MSAPAVYAAISACTAILMQEGISKSRQASMGKGGNYAFRGIDEFMNACAPAMHKAGLTMVPRVVDEKREEREKQGNGYTSVAFYVRLTMEFEFASVADGSTVIARTVGEAMDSGDKATNKAMSAALKYALMQTFMIPKSGIADSDEENHEGITPGPSIRPWRNRRPGRTPRTRSRLAWRPPARATRSTRSGPHRSGTASSKATACRPAGRTR